MAKLRAWYATVLAALAAWAFAEQTHHVERPTDVVIGSHGVGPVSDELPGRPKLQEGRVTAVPAALPRVVSSSVGIPVESLRGVSSAASIPVGS